MLVFLIWVFPSAAATIAGRAPIASHVTVALFLSCSLKGVEDPSVALAKALLKGFQEKKLRNFPCRPDGSGSLLHGTCTLDFPVKGVV